MPPKFVLFLFKFLLLFLPVLFFAQKSFAQLSKFWLVLLPLLVAVLLAPLGFSQLAVPVVLAVVGTFLLFYSVGGRIFTFADCLASSACPPTAGGY